MFPQSFCNHGIFIQDPPRATTLVLKLLSTYALLLLLLRTPMLRSVQTEVCYRVSHSKPGKVIFLWWRYRLWFWLISWILHVLEKGTFMPNSPVFIFLMLCAIYGSISQNLLFLNKSWNISTLRGLFQVIRNNKPSKIYIFL